MLLSSILLGQGIGWHALTLILCLTKGCVPFANPCGKIYYSASLATITW